MLAPALEKDRGNPDALYQHVARGLEDGFAAEVLPYAKHLEVSDTDPVRGAVIHGVTLLQLRKFAEARDVLEAARQRLGQHAYLETNIAKAYAGLELHAEAEAILWHSLELDPNQENGLGWYAALQKEKHGESGSNGAYGRAAQLEGSWRPQLWLARAALAVGDVETARTLYEQVLSHFTEVPADVLMQISGDLGNARRLPLAITLCAPRFAVQIHGLQVGNNLIKAYLESGQTQEARKLLELLYAQQRPDWQEHLVFWEKEIDKAAGRFGPLPADAPLEIELHTLAEPIWMRSRLGFEALLPGKDPGAPHIVLLCGSGAKEHDGENVVRMQPADDVGRTARGLPLLIAEELMLRTAARVTYVLPWMKAGGFALFEHPWDPMDKWVSELGGTWVFTTHIDARQDPWKVQLRAVDSKTGSIHREWSFDMSLRNSACDAIGRCVDDVLQLVGLAQAETVLARPPTDWLAHYLVNLEQGLAVCTADMAEGTLNVLQSERSIFDGMLRMAAELPTNLRVRMLLLSALEREQRRRPDVVAEYREKLLALEKKHPIADQRVAEMIGQAVRLLTEDNIVSQQH